MNIEKIKYFIDLVECKSFTETAKKNFVSQTTISQQMVSLENEFNIQLIDRKTTPIGPTEAGYLFYEEAKIIWKQYQTMLMKMSNFSKNHEKTLRIEYSAITDIKSLIDIIPLYKRKFTNIEVILDKVPLKNVADFLIRGVYDVAIAFDSEFYQNEKITTIPVYQGKYCAAVGKDHPLYDACEVSVKTLYHYPLVMLSPEAIGKSYELMIQNAWKDGYQPNIERTVTDIETELLMIRLENLIGFFPDNYSTSDLTEDIRLIPLQETHHHFKIVIAFLKENKDETVSSFVKTVKEKFHSIR